MNRYLVERRVFTLSVPRTRGDEPDMIGDAATVYARSPHTRG